MIFVSIITTVRNGARYIEDMLDSVSSQTHTSFEHIIVDDNSTDNTLAILERYQIHNGNYPLRLLINNQNGRGKALNLAVSKAKGPWVAIIDADDLWHPRKLEIQVAAINKFESTILATDSISFTGKQPYNRPYDNTPAVKSLRLTNLLDKNPICHSSVLIRKDLCMYDEDRISQFDLELWLRLLAQGHGIEIVEQHLTYHRKHENQSFEAKLGVKMAWNSFKLKASYSLKRGYILPLLKNTFRLLYVVLRRRNK